MPRFPGLIRIVAETDLRCPSHARASIVRNDGGLRLWARSACPRCHAGQRALRKTCRRQTRMSAHREQTGKEQEDDGDHEEGGEERQGHGKAPATRAPTPAAPMMAASELRPEDALQKRALLWFSRAQGRAAVRPVVDRCGSSTISLSSCSTMWQCHTTGQGRELCADARHLAGKCHHGVFEPGLQRSGGMVLPSLYR